MKNKQLHAFLLLLKNLDYPNKKIDLKRLSRAVGYDLDLLVDFYDEFGLEKTNEFVNKGIQKLFGDDMTFRIDFGDFGEYIVVELLNYNYDPNDDAQDVTGYYQIIDSAILSEPDGKLVPLRVLDDEYDPWDMNDLYDYLDSLIHDYFYKNLGYRIVMQ